MAVTENSISSYFDDNVGTVYWHDCYRGGFLEEDAQEGFRLLNVFSSLVFNPLAFSKWFSVIKNSLCFVDYDEGYTTITDAVKRIKEEFILNVTELAELLDVSRPTVYSYLRDDDRKPSGYADARIERLNMIINIASEKGLTPPYRGLLFRRNNDDRMIKNLISDGTITNRDIEMAILSEIQFRDRQPLTSRRRESKLSMNDEIGDVVYLED